MIFRRKQDEMEGFRRMREALRQQADPQDHALLDDDQYGTYDEEDAELAPLNDELEPPKPRDVPVLWNRPDPRDVQTGTVLRFPPRREPEE